MVYVRPSIPELQFRDADGAVIPYGHRWPDAPADASYSVTLHPERFAPLHAVARTLIEHLGGTTPEVGVPLRIDPPNQDASPVVITLTPFPGVMLQAGARLMTPFPRCGCDACDESVSDVAGELEEAVFAIVEGGFSESIKGFTLASALGSTGGDSASSETPALLGADGRPLAPRDWAPWHPSSD